MPNAFEGVIRFEGEGDFDYGYSDLSIEERLEETKKQLGDT